MGKKVKAIIGKIQYKFGDIPLYHKLLIIFGTGLGIEFLVALLILGFIGNAYNELLYEQADNAMSYFSRNLELALKDIEELSTNTISDSVVQKEMSEILGTSNSDYSYSVARTKLENQLMRNFYVQNDLITMSLIQESNLIVSVGKSASSDIYNYLGILEEDYAFGNKDWICVPEDYSLLYIRRIRKIENLSLKELGHLVIRIDFGKMISNAISARYQDEEKYMLCIQRDGEVLYNTQENVYPIGAGNWEKGYRVMDVNGNKMFVTYNRIKNYGWDIFYGIPYTRIFHSLTVVWIVAISILCIIFLLVGYSCNRGITHILWHFKYLEGKIRQFKESRISTFAPDVYDYRDRHDEIALIHRSFDEMTMEINNLIQENYEKQILIRDTKIKILEQQMNPHFLHNMLQVIEWHAKLSDRETTASIINTLGSFLRNTLKDNSEKITLKQELGIVNDYITLIEARYGDEVSFSIKADEACLDSMLPRMTIQPLVENAVYYGISEDADDVAVTVDVYRDEEVLVIDVCNTGSEIDEHILEHLESGEVTANGNGIGLRNIQERLNLTYGMGYGLSFSSADHRTIVRVRIPF